MPKIKSVHLFIFKSPRPSVVLVGTLLLYGTLLTNFQIYHLGFQSLQAVPEITKQWISIHDIYRLLFLLVIALWLVGYGQIRLSRLGFERQKLPFAALATILTWVLIQVVAATICLMSDHRLTAASPTFLKAMLSLFFGQLLGNSLLEEGVFRGYLIPYLRPYFKDSKWLALIVSSILFGLSHIPWFIFLGRPFYYLIPIMVAGVLFGLLYIKTQNLWLCIGLHGLIDAPAQLWGSSPYIQGVPILVGLLFIIFARPNPALNSDPTARSFRSPVEFVISVLHLSSGSRSGPVNFIR